MTGCGLLRALTCQAVMVTTLLVWCLWCLKNFRLVWPACPEHLLRQSMEPPWTHDMVGVRLPGTPLKFTRASATWFAGVTSG